MNNQSCIPSLKNPKFQYVPSANTDILKRFRATGWVPPSELKDKK
jgi:hypothetical protein